jgi:hypothetical protein
MKKLKEKQKTILSVSLVLLLTLCAFIIFWVGSHRTVQFEYLQHVDENGFSAYHDGELIYFHYPNASEEFRVCNTVRVAWWDWNMIEETYTYSDAVTGAEMTATVRVERFSVRRTIRWLGEPLYG